LLIVKQTDQKIYLLAETMRLQYCSSIQSLINILNANFLTR
jgi:hypothetical protein